MNRTKTCPMEDLSYWAALLARYARSQLDTVEPYVQGTVSELISSLDVLVREKDAEHIREALSRLEECTLAFFSDSAAPTNGESLPSQTTVRLILFLGLSLKKWKKRVSGVDPGLRRKDAICGFITRNAKALLPPDMNNIGERWIQTFLYPRMARILKRWLPDVSSDYWIAGRFGPGACMEGYPRAARFVQLSDTLDHLGAEDPDVFWQNDPRIGGCFVRLCAVPKSWDKDRLITVEPWVGGYLQQGVRSLILKSVHSGPLKGTAMDQDAVDGQRIQRQLATVASLGEHSPFGSRRLATIDLKDASDNITIRDVVSVFPAWVVRLLEGCRTPYFRSGNTTRDELHFHDRNELGIYAGMGNATTFIVETLFFAAFVEAVVQADTGLKRRVLRLSHGAVASVFGDDIICDAEVLETLATLGPLRPFVVNSSKTFSRGLLRESCGIYAFNGVDVSFPRIHGYSSTWSDRIALTEKLRQMLDDSQFYPVGVAALKAANALGLVGVSRYETSCYPSIGLCRLAIHGLQPSDSGTDVSIYSPLDGGYVALPVRTQQCRWNRNTQSLEVREHVMEQRVRRFSHVSHTGGVSPRVWLDKWFTGERSEATMAGSPADAFPFGRFRQVYRWLTTGQPTDGFSASADFSFTLV